MLDRSAWLLAVDLHERGVPFVVFEVGDDIADSVRERGHVQLFSPWGFNIDDAARRLLEAAGWVSPDARDYPTGADLIDAYLAPLALLPEIARLRTSRLVTSITRAGFDKVRTSGREQAPFVVTTEGPQGVERTLVRAVIDASGTWARPNPLGADGRRAIGERLGAADRIDTGIPDVLGRDPGLLRRPPGRGRRLGSLRSERRP